MKKIIVLGVLLLIFGVTTLFKEELFLMYANIFLDGANSETITENEKNEYYNPNNYSFVQNTNNFKPKEKQDILNIYYTVLNSGLERFTLFCDESYTDCLSDFDNISNNQVLLSHINNFVHPYNSFEKIETEYDIIGRVTIKIDHIYKKEQIVDINRKVEEIKENYITDDMAAEEKIKAIHNYVINNSKYDSERSDNNVIKYYSDIAYGNLLQGYGICGGYADSMKIFLDIFEYQNYKISSENHVWNLVQVGDTWLHLDLTWDDPVSESGKDILDYSFFLIDSTELKELETNQHNFDKNVYKEAI